MDMRILLLAALMWLPQLGTAQIFKSVDEHGNVSYSDTPPKSGPSEEVKLRITNSTPAPEFVEPLEPGPSAAPAGDDEPAEDYRLEIASPANETTIAMGPGNFSVTATIEPALASGDLLQLYVDGSPEGSAQSGSSWNLTNVFRGAHDLTVVVTDQSGSQLVESDPVRVYVLRPSVNYTNRNRPRPTPR